MSEQKRRSIFFHTAMTVIGGLGYTAIELLWRGRTHWSMFLVGGACFEMIGGIHARLRHVPMPLRCVVCSAAVTAVELVSGCILNMWLGMGVWDYSGMRFHLLGQICLLYSLLWLLLSAAVCPLYEVVKRVVKRVLDL